MEPAKSVYDLAADPAFEPDYLGPGYGMGRDPKPSYFVRRREEHVIRERLRCQVLGCGVDWAPEGVCGYCRCHVRAIRTGRATREAA